MFIAKVHFFDQYYEYTHSTTMYVPGQDNAAIHDFVIANWSDSNLGITPKYAFVNIERREPMMVVYE